MGNDQSMADEILKNIGGSGNVKNLTHCMTRIRFVLKDESKANDEAVKNMAGVMVHPAFMEIMEKAAEGKEATFAFVPVMSVKYTYTIIPAIVMTWLLKYIEDFADYITPIVMKNFLKPMLILLIAAPIAIIIVGPTGILI